MSYRWQERGFLAALLLGVTISLPVAAQQGDAYLQELDSEARDLNLDRETRGQQKEVKDMRSAAGLAEVPAEEQAELAPRLSQEEFEQDLRNNFFGSYSFYKRLEPAGKAKIYQQYLQDADPGQLRKRILEQLKKQRGK